MAVTTSQTAFRSILYGGASMLLAFDVLFLFRALLADNYIPIVPLLVGILTAGALLFIVYGEQKAREEDKNDHRRISRVAHQLESPLKTLQEDLSALLERAEKLPAEERLKLKRMETKTTVLLENVRDVFLMLQIAEHPLRNELHLYNACTLVHEVIERHVSIARAHNVELVYKAQCDDAPVFVDRQLFFVALSHLVENAILYTLTPGMVNVAVARSKNKVRIIVQDRGFGISPNDESVIFQPFARGSRAEQFSPDGIGVGLTLARAIAREFQGDVIWRNRQEGLGAEFELVLPLKGK